jgi:hypothetical protein
MDLFVVPIISFRLLYGLLILQRARRDLLCLAVAAHPTAEWIAWQGTDAFGSRSLARRPPDRSRQWRCREHQSAGDASAVESGGAL